MGLFDTATNYQHKAELRESKDEMLFGELIRNWDGTRTVWWRTPIGRLWASRCRATT